MNASARWERMATSRLLFRVAVAAAVFSAAVAIADWITRRLVRAAPLSAHARATFLELDPLTWFPLLATLLGAFGFQLLPPVVALIVLAVLAGKALLLDAALEREERVRAFTSTGWLAFLFLLSGLAALLYQVVWQRVLFATFGINIESITIIVSIFMFGLGIGSLVGGMLARRYPSRLIGLFVACELGVGAFGLVSLPLIALVSERTLQGSLASVGLAVFALLSVPTLLMGATLPILVSYLFRRYRNLGKSVGVLYCINTLGSAVACFLAADVLFVLAGQRSSVLAAVSCNWIVAALVLRYARRTAPEGVLEPVSPTEPGGPPSYGGDGRLAPGEK